MLKDEHKYIGFGGARGGGKSWTVRTKAKLLALRYPGIKILIVRRSYPELQENHINRLVSELLGVAKYNENKKELRFPNGSRILFRYCSNDKDAMNFQGMEFDVIFLDEATQFSEDQMRKISATLRGVNNFPKRIYYTCNPGGQGHGYIKRLFIDRNFQEDEDPDNYSFIQSLVFDNTALMQSDPDYVKVLEALPPRLRAAWLDGDWNVYEGQFFEDFCAEPDKKMCDEAGISVEQAKRERKFTHVIEPFEIPRHWKVYRSFDWGYSRPFSCGWWTADEDGTVYRIMELYGCSGEADAGVKWEPYEVFRKIKSIETEHRWLKGRLITGVADPAIWDTQRGESIAQIADKCGIYFHKADNARRSGWMQVHYRLHFDENGYPKMYVFNTCKNFIRTIPLLQYDEYNPEDLDTKQEDHIADETRYFLMDRPIKAETIINRLPRGDDPLDLYRFAQS